jgi:hypothetical protein
MLTTIRSTETMHVRHVGAGTEATCLTWQTPQSPPSAASPPPRRTSRATCGLGSCRGRGSAPRPGPSLPQPPGVPQPAAAGPATGGGTTVNTQGFHASPTRRYPNQYQQNPANPGNRVPYQVGRLSTASLVSRATHSDAHWTAGLPQAPTNCCPETDTNAPPWAAP